MSLAWPFVQRSGSEAPAGWSVRRIGDLVDLINGHPFDSADFSPTGVMPLVRIRDLMLSEFETYVDGEIPPRVVLADGDVVIGMDGDFNVIRWTRGPAALNQRLCLLRPRPGVDIRFVYYWLPVLLRILNDLAYSTTVKHLSSGEILRERLLLPSLDEQQRICDFLDEQVDLLDRAVLLKEQQRRLLDDRLEAEAHAALVGDLDPLRDGVPLRRLVTSVKTGGTPDSSEQWAWSEEGIPWYGPSSFDTNLRLGAPVRRLVPDALAKRVVPMFSAGSVLVVGIGATAGQIAYLDHAASGNQQVTSLTPVNGVDGRFLAWSLWVRRSLLLKTAPYTTLPILNNQTLLSVRLMSLSHGAQGEVASRLHRMSQQNKSVKDLLTHSEYLLQERKQALITAAVSGQFDVTTARRAA